MKPIKLMLAACGLAWAGAASAELPTDFLAENKAAAGETKSNAMAMSGSYRLRGLMALSDGQLVFSLDGTENINPKNCEKPSFVLVKTHSSYQLQKELLLMAYAMGKPVSLYTFECHSSGRNLHAYIYSN